MRFHVVTLFPQFFDSVIETTMLKKGRERGALEFSFYDIRRYATDRHRVTDDTPYGGGQGMVMKPEPLFAAIEATGMDATRPHRVLLCPQGPTLDDARVRTLAGREALALICGRYEGIDERVRAAVDEELSIGDYVVSGGEIAAVVVIDAVARHVPGVLGCAESALDESFHSQLLEYPQYTRPLEFRGHRVPEILLSGDHAAVARWRRQQALRRTWERRPDLLRAAALSADDRDFIAGLEAQRQSDRGPDCASTSSGAPTPTSRGR